MIRLEQLLVFYKENPKDPFIIYALALEYINSDQLNQAELYFNVLLNEHPEYSATYYQLGQLKLKQGKRQEAISIFESGIELCKRNKEQHALAELQSVLNNLLYDDDD